jgi:hypothetical protein
MPYCATEAEKFRDRRRNNLLKWLADLNYPKTTQLTCDDCCSTDTCRFSYELMATVWGINKMATNCKYELCAHWPGKYHIKGCVCATPSTCYDTYLAEIHKIKDIKAQQEDSPHDYDCACADCMPRSTPQHARREFPTGATRSPLGDKPQYEGYLSPLVVKRFGEYMLKHQTDSAGERRAADNWQAGIPPESLMDSAWRHFLDVWLHHRGKSDQAVEPMEDALCAIIFNMSAYLLHMITHDHNTPRWATVTIQPPVSGMVWSKPAQVCPLSELQPMQSTPPRGCSAWPTI